MQVQSSRNYAPVLPKFKMLWPRFFHEQFSSQYETVLPIGVLQSVTLIATWYYFIFGVELIRTIASSASLFNTSTFIP